MSAKTDRRKTNIIIIDDGRIKIDWAVLQEGGRDGKELTAKPIEGKVDPNTSWLKF